MLPGDWTRGAHLHGGLFRKVALSWPHAEREQSAREMRGRERQVIVGRDNYRVSMRALRL